jgi:YegS/Rv2252/BmrU family lipid kinase
MLHLVVNPSAGTGKGRRIFESLRPAFDETGVPYQVHYSGENKRIEDIVRELTSGSTVREQDSEFTDIVVIGGDGSMNGAVNGIADFDHTRLGLIPAGSGNDLARGLRITKDKRELIHTVCRRETVRSIDVGICETENGTRLFNISSGVGFDAATCFFAERSRLKRELNSVGLGKLVYITEALRLILRNETFRCEIKTADGQERVYDRCLFAVGMNHKYEGGGFMFCPEASGTDGQLDFCVADGIGTGKFMWVFPKALKGKHTKYKGVDVFRTDEVYITIQTPSYIHTDGEAECIEHRMRMAVYDKKLQLIM